MADQKTETVDQSAWEAKADSFEIKVRDWIKEDYEAGKKFLGPFHRKIREHLAEYHNAGKFTSLRRENKFPVPYIQKMTDQAVADFKDKLFYSNQPATVVGREETDKEDATAKQAMMAFQDEVDQIFLKFGRWLRDACLARMMVGQVDYKETWKADWDLEDTPEYATDAYNQPIFDPSTGMPVQRIDAQGQPMFTGEKQWVRKQIKTYCGAATKRVHPLNFFFTGDKEEIDDEFPLMVRSWQSRRFFDTQGYFFNQEYLAAGKGPDTDAQLLDQSREHQDLEIDRRTSKRPHKYVEWQRMVPKAELFKYLARKREDVQEIESGKLYMRLGESEDDTELIEIQDKEWCWAIGGMADDEILVRLDDSPFDGPNVVFGMMMAEDEGLLGKSLADVIESVHKGFEELMGMFLTNFKQSIDAFWIINENAVTKKGQLLNAAGKAFFTNKNPRDVMMRVEQPQLAQSLFQIFAFFDQMGKDSSGISSIVEGKGDRAADTATESTQALMQGMLRVRDYLKTIEESFVKPLWYLRNAVNSLFIDEEYAYRVVGKKADAWRKIKPEQIRSQVDFVCESSTRETQRAVVISQILQLAKIAPLALQAGQPVRLDKLGAKLCEVGFSWSEDQIKEIWPLIALEEQIGADKVNKMLAENAMMAQAVQRLQLAMAAGGAGMLGTPGGQGQPGNGQPAGQNLPEPTNEADAIKSAMSEDGRMIKEV